MANYTYASGGAITEILTKENVQDLLTNLFPLDTTLSQWCEAMPMGSQPYIEYPLDTFSGTSTDSAFIARTSAILATNAKAEGSTATSLTPVYPKKFASVAEIHQESFQATGTDRMLTQYGILDRYTYEALKTTQKVVNDQELSYWYGAGSLRTAATRLTQGLVRTIVQSGLERTVAASASFTDNVGNALTLPFYSNCYNANGVNLDLSMFEHKLMGDAWTNGFEPDGAVVFTGTKTKSLIHKFALTPNGAINERKIDAAEKRVIDAVDVIETQHGVHFINKTRYLSIGGQSQSITLSANGPITMPWDEVCVAVMPRYWKIGVFRGVGYAPIAKTGDFDQGMIVGESGMCCMNPIAGTGVINQIA